MKLLTPLQNKDNKDEQTLRGILRTQELRKAEEKARLELAKSQADFNSTLAENRNQWAKEEEEHMERIKERKIEIDRLEAKRLNALIPIDILKASAEEQLADAEEYAKTLREKEEANEILAEKLQDKLDEVGQKEQDLKREKQQVSLREDNLKRQEQANIFNTKSLNSQMAEFFAKKTEEEKQHKAKFESLSLWEQSLDIQEEENQRVERQNQEKAIRLEDERGVLERAWRELERKKSK